MIGPGIAYVVCTVAQFVHASRTICLHAVKRIFRYPYGIADHGGLKEKSKLDVLVLSMMLIGLGILTVAAPL